MRTAFRLLVHESQGQRYEDLFVKIMSYKYPEFKPVKAHGRVGDRGNDGWVADKGRYYQCYAPEFLAGNTRNALKKLNEDFERLKGFWWKISPIREFYFVINDKFMGVSPHIYDAVKQLERIHNLERAEVLLASELENSLFTLDDDQIKQVLNFFDTSPRAKNLKVVDFFVVDEDTEDEDSWVVQATTVELKLRNAGSEVAFVKEIRFITVCHWDILTDAQYQLVDVSANYDVLISETPGSVAKKKIHHKIKSQETDRIRFTLHPSCNASPDGLSLFYLKVGIYYNEEARPLTCPPTIVNLRKSGVIMAAMTPLPKDQTIRHNKSVAREVLGLHGEGVVIDDYVVGALESWKIAPDTLSDLCEDVSTTS